MPYKSKAELPETVKSALKDVPHAQDIYRKAFNSAWDEYKDPGNRRDDADREEVAHRVAWSAVKQKYEKALTINGIPTQALKLSRVLQSKYSPCKGLALESLALNPYPYILNT